MRDAVAHPLEGDTPFDELVRTQDQALLGAERPPIGDLAVTDADLSDLLLSTEQGLAARRLAAVDPAVGSPAQQWAATAGLLAGVGRVRLGKWEGKQFNYPAGRERRLTDRLPADAAAVRVYGHDGACAALFLDLDVSRGGVDAVDRDAGQLAKWLTECGARFFQDLSPTGGRHIYVPLAERLAFPEAREIVEAIALRFATVDAGPHRSVRSGCIRTPGSKHKHGGWSSVTSSLAGAVDVLQRPNPADVVQALRIRLAPQIAAWHAAQAAHQLVADAVAAARPDDQTTGGRRALSLAITRIAREGIYDPNRYGRSEARAAVLTAAARAGWSLADVAVRLEDGRWPGLAGLLQSKDSRTRPWRTFLADEWRSAQVLVATTPRTVPGASGQDHVLRSNTSMPKSLAGGSDRPERVGAAGTVEERRFIRTWSTAVLTYEHRFAGEGTKLGWLLRALAEFAQKTGSRVIGVGTRSLAVAVGGHHTTVASDLHALQELGWVDQIEAARGVNADVYELRIPEDAHVDQLRWHSGKIHAKRPAFRTLGDVAGLVFEALEQDRGTTISELVSTTRRARSAVSAAIDVLCAYGLVDRSPTGLIAHPDRLARVAEDLGVTEAIAVQLATYARQRREWRAYLARHDNPQVLLLSEHDFCDPEMDEYWLPPPDEPAWSLVDLLAW